LEYDENFEGKQAKDKDEEEFVPNDNIPILIDEPFLSSFDYFFI